MDPFPVVHQDKPACAIISRYNGPAGAGQAVMAKLLGELPAPLFNWMGEMQYLTLQSMFDTIFRKGCNGAGAAIS